MGIRAKVRRSTPRRGTVAVASRVSRPTRTTRAERSTPHTTKLTKLSSKTVHHDTKHDRCPDPRHDAKHPAHPGNASHAAHANGSGITSYSKALRFLATLSDYERLRIVRYNSQ